MKKDTGSRATKRNAEGAKTELGRATHPQEEAPAPDASPEGIMKLASSEWCRNDDKRLARTETISKTYGALLFGLSFCVFYVPALFIWPVVLQSVGSFLFFSFYAGIVSAVLAWIVYSVFSEQLRRRVYRHATVNKRLAAEEVLAAVKEGGLAIPPFILYLRSFESDRLTASWYGAEVEGAERVIAAMLGASVNAEEAHAVASTSGTGSLDHEIAHSLPEYIVVALGAADDGTFRTGATRVRVPNEEWHDTIRSLMSRADAILILPLTTDGLLFEVVHIASQVDLATKTLLFLPPRWSEEKWRITCDKLAISKIIFPKYRPSGAVFDLNGRLEPPVRSRDQLRQLILDRVKLAKGLSHEHKTGDTVEYPLKTWAS